MQMFQKKSVAFALGPSATWLRWLCKICPLNSIPMSSYAVRKSGQNPVVEDATFYSMNGRYHGRLSIASIITASNSLPQLSRPLGLGFLITASCPWLPFLSSLQLPTAPRSHTDAERAGAWGRWSPGGVSCKGTRERRPRRSALGRWSPNSHPELCTYR